LRCARSSSQSVRLSIKPPRLSDSKIRSENTLEVATLSAKVSHTRIHALGQNQNGNPGALGCRFGYYNQLEAGAYQPLRGESFHLAKHRDYLDSFISTLGRVAL
jgi:hypothetical protein